MTEQNSKLNFKVYWAIAVFGIMALSGGVFASDELSALRTNQKKSDKENDLNALKAEMLISKSEEQAINQINVLLKKYRGTAMEPDLLFRLAELHMRRAKTDRFLEFNRQSEVIVQFAPKLVKQAQSRRAMQSAIAIYDDIERRYPRYEKIDLVIFNNAFANQQINITSKAEVLYKKLVRNYKNSDLLPDAYLALGEMLFAQKNFTAALENFKAIRKYPDSMVYPYGLYKAAWAYYNLRDAENGLKELEDVIKYGRFVQTRKIDSRLDLRREALIDMALFYSDVRPAKLAYDYFAQQSGDLDLAPAVLRISKIYKRHSRYADNKTVLSEFIRRQPKSGHLPIAYIELMDSSEKLKKRNDVVVLLENLYAACDSKSVWSRAQPQNVAQLMEYPLREMNETKAANVTASAICQGMFEKTALSYANRWHRQWLKTPDEKGLAASTEKAFALFLEKTPANEESSKARFVYAEILFKQNKFRLASEQYARSVLHSKDDKISHDGRYFAILSLEKAVDNKWSDEDEKKLRILSTDYLKTQQKGVFRLDIEFKMALIAYEKGRYSESAPIFLRLGKEYAQSEKGLQSQDLYLDTLNLQKNYTQLRDYAFDLRKSAKGAERVQKLTKIYEESYFLIIQEMEAKGNYKDAVAEYNKFAAINPKSALAEKCLWNAMQLLFKMGNLAAGAEAAVAYQSKYSTTKEGVDALKKAAQTYEGMAQLKSAAKVLLQLAKFEPNETYKWTNLAADFYLLENMPKEAKPLYEQVRKSNNKELSSRALEKLTQIALAQGNTSAYEAYLREAITLGQEPSHSAALLYFAQKDFNNKKFTEAFDRSKKIIGQANRGAQTTTLAQARLIQARILGSEFRSQSVKSRLSRLELVLQLKTEKLQKAQIAYQSAAKYGDPDVAVLAYRELADCYLHFSEALKTMPIPEDLPEAEHKVFRDEIAKLIMPIEEQGYETKILALKTSQQFHTGHSAELQKEVGPFAPSAEAELTPRVMRPAAILPKMEGTGA